MTRIGSQRSMMALVWCAAALCAPGLVNAQPVPQPIAPPNDPNAPIPAPNPPGLFAPTPASPSPNPADAPANTTPPSPTPAPTPIAPPSPSPVPTAPIPVPDPSPDADEAADEPDEELPGPPEGHEPELEVTLDPTDGLMTGDLLTVTVRAVVPQTGDVTMRDTQEMGEVDVPGGVPPAELLGIESLREPVDDARHAFVFTVRILVLRPGDHVLGPLAMRVISDDGRMGFARTEPLSVTVGSLVGNEPDAQPRPPTEPVSVLEEDNRLWYALAVLGVLLLGAIIGLLLVRWNDKRKRAPKPPPPPRPAWEVALEKLDALRKSRGKALREGETEPWVDGVSDAVREYLGGRYGFVGLESTSDEVVEHLKSAPLTGVSAEDVRAFLIDCDLVKFARAEAGDEQTDGLLAMAYRIVRETRGVPDATDEPEAPQALPPPVASEVVPAAPAPAVPSGDERWAPGLSADRDVSIPPTNLALEEELAPVPRAAVADPVVPAPVDAAIPATRVDEPDDHPDASGAAASSGATRPSPSGVAGASASGSAATGQGRTTMQGPYDETVPAPRPATTGAATTRLEDVSTVPVSAPSASASGAGAGAATLHDASLLGTPITDDAAAAGAEDEVLPTPAGPGRVATKVGFEPLESSSSAGDPSDAAPDSGPEDAGGDR